MLFFLFIRAFGSGHIGGYRQPAENPTNHRYRNVILTNELSWWHTMAAIATRFEIFSTTF
jgi:hypothetical protein